MVLNAPERNRNERTGFLSAIARSHFAPAALIAICLAVYLPGLFSIPPIDRDESRFAQASRQMFESVALPPDLRNPQLHSGGFAIPYVIDKPRLNKPPLIYWLQTASAAAFSGGDPFRDAIWMYRIPGVLCAIGSVLATWGLALSMTSRLAAFLAAGGLALCPVVVLDAHQARADQLLLLTVVLTQWTIWKIFRGDQSLKTAFLFWLFVSLGIAAKGPITPLVGGTTVIALSLLCGWRWVRSIRPLLGAVVVTAIVGPWVAAVAGRVGWGMYFQTVWGETIGRSVEGKEGHWGPPGYHTLLAFFLLWPVALGLPGVIAVWWRRVRGGDGSFIARLRAQVTRRPVDAFLFAWVVPSWIVFELVGTKLPHYTLPLYPVLCILGARMLVSVGRVLGREGRPRGAFLHLTRIWFGTGIVVLVGIGACVLSLSWWRTLGWWEGAGTEPRTNWLLVPGVLAMLTLMILGGKELARMRVTRALAFSWTALALGFALLLSAVAPEALGLSSRIAARLRPSGPGEKPVLSGYSEDSLVFLLRGNARRVAESELPSIAGATRADVVSSLPVPKGASDGRTAEELRGLNIAKGRCQSVVILRAERNP